MNRREIVNEHSFRVNMKLSSPPIGLYRVQCLRCPASNPQASVFKINQVRFVYFRSCCLCLYILSISSLLVISFAAIFSYSLDCFCFADGLSAVLSQLLVRHI